MKIIALCSVDESVLRSTLELGEKDTIDVDTVTSEFGWLNDSGIVLDACHETKKVEEVTEYWGFIWNLKREKYVPITIPCSNVDSAITSRLFRLWRRECLPLQKEACSEEE